MKQTLKTNKQFIVIQKACDQYLRRKQSNFICPLNKISTLKGTKKLNSIVLIYFKQTS